MLAVNMTAYPSVRNPALEAPEPVELEFARDTFMGGGNNVAQSSSGITETDSAARSNNASFLRRQRQLAVFELAAPTDSDDYLRRQRALEALRLAAAQS
jgi:hypothetical protein